MKPKLITIFIFLSSMLFSQYNGERFYISANYIYTTTSKLYLQPNSSDEILRGTHIDFEDIWSYSGEFGYFISDGLIIGLSVEFIERTYLNRNMNLGGIRAVMTDGFKVMPMEFALYYTLPFSTEKFKFFMGGGGGAYFGTHIRKLGNVSVSTESRKIGYGLQAAVGVDYIVKKYFAVRAQMRFRDPEFEMKNSYSSKIVNYEGITYILPSQTFDSKVNIDGMSFSAGILFLF